MSEQLTSFVIDGSSISIHSLMKNVQNTVFLILLSKVSSETCVKAVIFYSIRTRMNMIFSARGDKGISYCQTGQPVTGQTRKMEMSFQKPYSEFWTAHAVIF